VSSKRIFRALHPSCLQENREVLQNPNYVDNLASSEAIQGQAVEFFHVRIALQAGKIYLENISYYN